MVTYFLPAVLFGHFILMIGGILYGIDDVWYQEKRNRLIAIAVYIMALISVAAVLIIVYFPFPVMQDEILFNTQNELGQVNNFIPFYSICHNILDAFHGYIGSFLLQCIGNILLFVPFGFFVRILSQNWKKVFVMCIVFSLSIELMQGLFGILLGYMYRSVDIDDLLLNVAGGILGGEIAARLVNLPKGEKK